MLTPFIELNRRFRMVDANTKPEETALESYAPQVFWPEHALTWDEVLKRDRVVVLGEAGSGKSWELRERARILRGQGKFAFFIRLDQLITQELEELLSSDEQPLYRAWKRNLDEAFFFLDSVDEAKFGRISDFLTVLDRVRNAISFDQLRRAKIILSSRISEWKPGCDASEFRRRFPSSIGELRASDTEPYRNEELEPEPLVVHLEPLDRFQVELLAHAMVTDVKAFIQTLDTAYAWEFARRPLDVVELVGFWNETGRIGSLTELVEFDVSSKLQARTGRDEHPLSEADAHEGAEWLAAAAIFARRFSFGTPEDGAGVALNPSACLPTGWSDDQIRALSNRALFDGAAYGCFRFHHRRIAEYLASQWIATRMKEGCPPEVLENILVEKVRDRKVIRPGLRSVAAWLCCGNEPWNQHVRSWVVEANPEVHFKYGDAAALSIDYKRMLLRASSQKVKGRERVWLNSSDDSLARIATPEMSSDISQLILDRTLPADFRSKMLDIACHGRLAECLDSALKIADDPDESEGIKVHAVEAIGAIEEQRGRIRLMAIAFEEKAIPNRFCARIVEVLYPNTISAPEMAQLLKKSSTVNDIDVDLPFFLKRHFESILTPDLTEAALKALVDLAKTPPLISDTVPVSKQFYWVGRCLTVVLKRLFKKTFLSPSEMDLAAEGLQLLGYIQEYDYLHREDLDDLNSATLRHPGVRRCYLWRLIGQFRQEHNQEPTTLMCLVGPWEVLKSAPADFTWLLKDIQERFDRLDQVVALHLSMELWASSGRTWARRRQLKRAITNDIDLQNVFRQSVITSCFFPLKRFWWHNVRLKYGKLWWHKQFWKIRERYDWMRSQFILMRNLGLVESGEPINWLDQLIREADRESTSQYAPTSWSDLEKKRGKGITQAAQRGCKIAWRRFKPLLPHEKPNPSETGIEVAVGLTGLRVEFEGGKPEFIKLSPDEANLATRYAVNELNGFPPWLVPLAGVHPEPVSCVLGACIEAEWITPTDRQDAGRVLSKLALQERALVPLVEAKLMLLLHHGDPQHPLILRLALSVLMHLSNPPIKQLADFARQRIATTQDFGATALWLSVLFQIDGEGAIIQMQNLHRSADDVDKIVVRLCSILSGEEMAPRPSLPSPSYLHPRCLRHFIPLVYGHVRMKEDIDRQAGKAFSPGARDHAERFRGVLLDRLCKDENPDATDALIGLADDQAMADVREWVLDLISQRLEREAEMPPWGPGDIREFAQSYETDPKTDRELFAIATRRIQVLKWQVERSDNSLRDELHADQKEIHFRRWLARKLNAESRGRYNVPQEPEIDLQQRPDLRFLNPKTAPVSVEAKLANMGWTVADLLERLENQLGGQYLRAHDSRFGIYVIGTIGEKMHWEHPKTAKLLEFSEVIDLISARATELLKSDPHIGGIVVVGIDFREPKRSNA